jgi:hypothetical protein
MGWGGVGMPSRTSDERLEANIESLRSLVNAGSQSVIRDAVVGSAISGSRRKYPLPSIGYRSGKLTVTGYIAGQRHGVKALIVRCDCGLPEYTVDHQNFKNFKSTRCNVCAKKAAHGKRYWKYVDAMYDDAHRIRLLNRLSAAITRCHNPSSSHYGDYGGRGIQVLAEWREDRTAFLRYVQTLEGWDVEELEMDRINNNKGYELGNIRFASRSVNMQNRRKVSTLEQELADLRHRLQRAEESLHDLNGTRADPST